MMGGNIIDRCEKKARMTISRILNGYRDMAVQIYECKNNVNGEKKGKLILCILERASL